MPEESKTTTNIDPEKLKLEREILEKEKLRIFFMFIKRDNIVPVGEQIGAFIAYRPQDAMTKALQDYPGTNIFYQGQSIMAEDFIKQIYLRDVKIEIEKEPVAIIPPVEMEKLSLEQFRAGLILASKELIKDEVDKKKIEEILKKL